MLWKDKEMQDGGSSEMTLHSRDIFRRQKIHCWTYDTPTKYRWSSFNNHGETEGGEGRGGYRSEIAKKKKPDLNRVKEIYYFNRAKLKIPRNCRSRVRVFMLLLPLNGMLFQYRLSLAFCQVAQCNSRGTHTPFKSGVQRANH